MIELVSTQRCTDALFVAPQREPVPADSPYRDEDELVRRGLLGGYRRELGWTDGTAPPVKDTYPAMFATPLPAPADDAAVA